MKERGMLFSAAMVRALLDGSKVQTRRVVRQLDPAAGAVTKGSDGKPMGACWAFGGPVITYPYGNAGDRIWVRETFIAYGRWETRFSAKKARDEWHFVDMTAECDRAYQYAADGPDVPLAKGRGGALPGWYTRPAIFMPRAASRILLEITGVRVERLNEISEADARAEGAAGGHGVIPSYNYNATPSEHFSHIWESVYGAGSWADNPWCWAISFRRVAP